MKTVYLLRHAKSSWDHPGLRDHDRPLAGRGRRAAAAMGAYMRNEGLVPDHVLCSTAVRTRETWALVAQELDGDMTVEYDRALYGASSGGLLASIHAAHPEVDRLLLIGHNPAMEALAYGLAGDGDPREIEAMRVKYPTAALAVLETGVDAWADVAPEGCTLERFVKPKDLPDAEALRL